MFLLGRVKHSCCLHKEFKRLWNKFKLRIVGLSLKNSR